MQNLIIKILIILALVSGQFVKIPLFTHGGMILLDLVVLILDIYGTFALRLKFKKFPVWIILAAGFITISITSLILTPLNLVLQEYFTSLSYIIRFFLYIFLGFLIVNGFIKNPSLTLKQTLYFSGVILVLLGIPQLILFPDLSFLTSSGWDPHYFRTISTFLDPNFLGAYTSLTLIILYQNFAMAKKWYIIFFTLLFLALMTTFSRGAYLGFVAGFLLLSLLQRSLKLLGLTILLSMLLLSSYVFYQKVIAHIRNIDRTQSAQYRLSSWQQGITLFQNYPILGVGFNAYRYALEEFKMGDDQFLQSHGASSNDSSLLYVLATTGIVGLFCYLFFLGSLFWTGYQNFISKREGGIILVVGLVTLFTQSFFSNTLFYPPLLLWLVLVASTTEKS